MSMPVSGPGALSQRTDRQPMRDVTGLPYGEGQAMRDMQRGAPMSATPPTPTPPLSALTDPTARPAQPITAGAAAGPGPGPEVLSTGTPAQGGGGRISQALARAAASDPSGELAQLLVVAQQKGV